MQNCYGSITLEKIFLKFILAMQHFAFVIRYPCRKGGQNLCGKNFMKTTTKNLWPMGLA